MSYDRYNRFRINGDTKFPPFIPIKKKNTDIYEYYKRGKTRLDVLSYKYYDDSDYVWLILQANPEYGMMEFLIPDNVQIRIPYPLDETIATYDSDIQKYVKYNNF